jgi:hypothetical protein
MTILVLDTLNVQFVVLSGVSVTETRCTSRSNTSYEIMPRTLQARVASETDEHNINDCRIKCVISVNVTMKASRPSYHRN